MSLSLPRKSHLCRKSQIASSLDAFLERDPHVQSDQLHSYYIIHLLPLFFTLASTSAHYLFIILSLENTLTKYTSTLELSIIKILYLWATKCLKTILAILINVFVVLGSIY